MVILRGEIWWAFLPQPEGSEPGYRRPVVIIQDDSFNQTRLSTVIVVILTSNLRLADMPGNVRLSARTTGLSKESVANVTQLITLDKDFLSEKIGDVAENKMKSIEDGLRLVLGL